MDWFRCPVGLTRDVRLWIVAKRAGVHRGCAFAAWIAVLEHACQRDHDGYVGDLSTARLAEAVDIPIDKAEQLLRGFYEKGLLRNGYVREWEEKYKKPVSWDDRLDLPKHTWRKIRQDILLRDGRRCRYCWSNVGPFEIDHVIPVSRGGGSEPDNLVVACRLCNRRKKDRTPYEWLANNG